MNELSIISLNVRPEFTDACAAWAFGEWGCHKKNAQLKKSITRYESAALPGNKLPRTWIGLTEDKIAGMISLAAEDHPERTDLSPWIVSFFIHPRFRGRGYAHIFMKHAEKETKEFGYDTAYLYTPDAQAFYEKHGWTTFEQRPDPTGLNPHVHLMKKVL